MIGLILAAGAGSRLRPLTDRLPKALLPVRGDDSILDLSIANLAQAGIETVAIVTGHAEERFAERLPTLRRNYGVDVELIPNPKADEWNNAYSLWCARDLFAEGVLLVNGDTVHPSSVEAGLLSADADGIVIAVDDDPRRLTAESMKVVVNGDGSTVRHITKAVPTTEAHGEYIGVARIGAASAGHLAESLERTWRRDPNLYYEDGFVEYIRTGGTVTVSPIGAVEWVEVDDHDDLARARDLACRY